MRVDLHVHTYPASSCSTIAYRDLIACCREQHIAAIALTNHGDVSDNRRLEGPLETLFLRFWNRYLEKSGDREI